LADGLAELGCATVIVDCVKDAANAVSEALTTTYGAESSAFVVDLADDNTPCEIIKHTILTQGRLDILINAAAFVGTSELEGWAVPFEQQTVETWRQALEVNLTSIFALSQAALPELKKGGGGSIINIASIYGVVGPDMRLYEGTGMSNPAAYGASKGGLLQLTRWLSTALAPKVRVNAITPGGIARGQDAKFVERYNSRVPLQRMGTEEDIKGAGVFLASDLSRYVTGQNLIVDGGWTAW
jgi:NAD(P)-dependent dehydrogenase (short-subunit alcohol dehydrogenase family)